MSELELEQLGSVLLVGGSGFLGHFVIQQLISSQCATSISIADLRPPESSIPNVRYYHLDVSSESSIQTVLAATRPRLIFHLASPLPGKPRSLFHSCNIIGTSSLLRLAEESDDVEALIYTSTNQVLANPLPSTTPLDESQAILFNIHDAKRTFPYGYTKAIADAMTQEANSPSLKIAVLRFPNVYGGTEPWMSMLMDDFRAGRTKMQMSETSAIVELISVESAARAHVLAASALLSSDNAKAEQIAGEAFFFSDEQPDDWYHFARKVWAIAGDEPGKIIIIPFWVLFAAAWAIEWFVWVLSLGHRESLMFNVINIRKLRDGQHVFDVSKAKKLLGFQPISEVEREEGIKRAVMRNIEHYEKHSDNR